METTMKMPARLRSLLPGLGLVPLLVAGCVAPWPALATCPEEGCPETDTETDTGATTFSSVTIDPNSSGGSTSGTTGGDSDATGSTTLDVPPAAPPSLESYSLWANDSDENEPLVLHKNGAVQVYAEASHADGVRVELDDGDVIELVSEIAGVFRGQVAFTSSLENGDRTATLVPYREDYGDGEPAFASFAVELPAMGEELVWAVDEYLGKGWVVDVELLSNGDIIELGTLLGDDYERTCFLRRRTPQGAYDPSDVVTLLDGEPCEAVGLEVQDDQLFILANWNENGGRWWLGDMPAWGLTVFPLAQGEAGATATALALREDRAIAICGTTSSGYGDLDAFAWVREWGQQPDVRTFDYVPEGDGFPEEPHTLDETPRDCLFAGDDQLVIAGDAYGRHDKDLPNTLRHRRFFLPVDLTAADRDDPPPFIVAAGEGPGDAAQSFATAVDIDDQGRLLVTGYTCQFPCKESDGHLWVHHLDGTLDWFTSLGHHDYPELAPTGLRSHPAGYTVVGSGGLGGKAAFVLRAFTIGDYEPLWTYARSDPLQEHFPMAVTLGPYGQICAGGFTNGTYPGVVCVGS